MGPGMPWSPALPERRDPDDGPFIDRDDGGGGGATLKGGPKLADGIVGVGG